MKLKKPVVLVGMMGAGKTAVGRALATRLGVSFNDSDAEITAAAQMSIEEIFARDGESFFRAREAEVLDRLLTAPPGVLATGGGAFLRPETRARIEQLGVSVWLDADLELTWERVRGKSHRPLLQTEDPYGTLAKMMAERRPIYAQAELRVAAHPDYSIADMAGHVLATLKTCPDVLEMP